jgi:hypothetical protein
VDRGEGILQWGGALGRTMIHTALLVMAISIFLITVTFLYIKDYLPDCSPETARKFEIKKT